MSLNIKDIKYDFQESLKNNFLSQEVLEIWNQWVVKEILNLSLINYFLQENFDIDLKKKILINNLIKHLLRNEPVQYFFGYTYFKDLKININSNVLIPRPETEELIDFILRDLDSIPNTIIDIGTGSGCIAIALKKHLSSNILGVDFCNKALDKAKLNAQLHNVDINFKFLDILSDKNYHNFSNFDVIVSNPPYVCNSDVSVDSNIHAEPAHAIFVPDNNPLVFYESICLFSKKHLNKGGRIFLEINPNFISSLIKLLSKYEYQNIKIHKDFYGKKRFIIVYS